MQYVLIIVFVMSSLPGYAQGEWRVINPIGVPSHIRNVEFRDRTVGLMIQDGGFLSRTSDGGATWSVVHQDTSLQNYFIRFMNDSVVYCILSQGRFLISQDAGTSWSTQQLPVQSTIYSVDIGPDGVGLAGIAAEYYLRTTDGGLTWGGVASPAGLIGARFVATGADNALYMLLENGQLYRSDDKGRTATKLALHANVHDLRTFGDSGVIVLTKTGTVAVSSDRGVTWVVNTIGHGGKVRIHRLDTISVDDANGSAYSTDRGVTWQDYLYPGLLLNTTSVRVGPYTAWQATHGGVFKEIDLRTGVSKVINGFTRHHLYGGHITDRSTIYAVGIHEGRSFPDVVVYWSTDGGEHWELRSNERLTDERVGCEISGTDDNLVITAWARAFVSRDGGATWLFSGPPFCEYCVYSVAADPTTIVISPTGKAHPFAVYRSTNTGSSWHAVSDSTWPGVYGSVVRIGSDTFLVCTDNAIYRSIDDGLTFSQMYRRASTEPLITRLVATSSGAVFALQGRTSLMRSIDGGTTWHTITAVNPIPRYYVRFADSLHGSGADDKTFYITDDGGRTWQEQPIPFVRYGIKMTIMLSKDRILLGSEHGLLAMWTRTTTSVPHSDNRNSSRIKVYPNPVASSGQLTIAGMSTDNARIHLTDLLGNVKGRWDATSPSTQVHLSPCNVTSGVYFIAIEERGRVEVHPVIVVSQ